MFHTFLDLIPVKVLRSSGRLQAFNPDAHLKATIGQNIYAVSGVAITLRCLYVASPPAKLTWLINSTKIEKGKEFFFGGTNDALIIPKMSPAYNGRYTCSAKQGRRIRLAHSKIVLLCMY